MRRSAAPSLSQGNSKRPKFSVPLRSTNSPSTEFSPKNVTPVSINNSATALASKFGLDLDASSQEDELGNFSPQNKENILSPEIQKNDSTKETKFPTKSSKAKFLPPTLKNGANRDKCPLAASIDNARHEPAEITRVCKISSSNEQCGATAEKVTNKLPGKKFVKPSFKPPACQNKFNSPQVDVGTKKSQSPAQTNEAESDGKSPEYYYSVVWCKASNKKHKKWEGDGILITCGKSATLKDMEGKQIAKSSGYKSSDLSSMVDGSTLFIGGKEIEVQNTMDKSDYLSGSCFSDTVSTEKEQIVHVPVKKDVCLPFRAPSVGGLPQKALPPVIVAPRHDPNKEGALVMPRPSTSTLWQSGQNKQIVDVVVDPFLSIHLRPHQREGVTFLYECVMGMRGFQGNGAILADEMGLGKTLQCISLVWTLLKQGPYGGTPTCKKVIILTPGSLVNNWCKEFIKWLGSERIQPFAISSNKRVDEFVICPRNPVMIISYEMFLRCIEDVRKVKFDMIICDEAHRLKNAAVKTASAITGLFIAKRVLLTGTPIQNDLQEFHALAEMANPGILGSLSGFKKVFEEPITRSQQPSCDHDEKELGASRANQLGKLSGMFCLRRTAEINEKYLPPKVESVVFCRLTDLQERLYTGLLHSRFVRSCLSSSYDGSQHLVCINVLKKLCNDPSLVYTPVITDTDEKEEDSTSLYKDLSHVFPDNYADRDFTVEHSGKLLVLAKILENLSQQRKKSVLVSNSTKTLDVLEKFCEKSDYVFVRLDGQTPVQARQGIVDRFNSKSSSISVFLLSSKAGGVGLNLTGASTLVLYDIDWNPANDMQAMARVWRDGQKSTVQIYRLLLCGTIEEKIYQRQIIKQGLSGTVVDAITSDKTAFSKEDLKDLFTLHQTDTCSTHELLQCNCIQNGGQSQDEFVSNMRDSDNYQPAVSSSSNKKKVSMAELNRWTHIHDVTDDEFDDPGLKDCAGMVQFIFQNRCNEKNGPT